MKVIRTELMAVVDVDGTLVHWPQDYGDFSSETEITIDFAGEHVTLHEYSEVVRYMKQLRSRGFYIHVWSGNGWAHAEQVVRGLELDKYVDSISSKPLICIDDKSPSEWMKWIEVGSVKA